MAGFFHLIGVFSLLAATVLLIVVSVSLPVWKSVYFLDVDFSVSSSIGGLRATSDHLRLGNWGLCLGDVCTKARLGYNLDFIENNTSGDLHLAASILHGATYALILHPIAAGFTFLALLVSLSTHFVVGILASVLALWAFVLTLIAFVIDLVIFITARDRLTKHSSSLLGSSDLSASYGPALWLVLTAFILQLIASVTVCLTRHQSRRAVQATPTQGKGGWFARRRQVQEEGEMMREPQQGRFWRRGGAVV